jgi:hypothetical protein
MSISGYFLVWLTVFFFKDVLAFVETMDENYRRPSFALVYVLLAFILAYPLVSSYYFITTQTGAPAQWQMWGFGLMLVGMLGVFKITFDLVLFSGLKFFQDWMWIYAFGILIATSFFAAGLDFQRALAQYVLTIAEIVFGFFLFAVARYTRDFGTIKIPMGETALEKRFTLNNAFIFAAVLLPAHGVVRAFGMSAFSLPASQGLDWAVEAQQQSRILANFALIIAAGTAAWAMRRFKNDVLDVCVNMSAMYLLKKNSSASKPARAKNKLFKRRNS